MFMKIFAVKYISAIISSLKADSAKQSEHGSKLQEDVRAHAAKVEEQKKTISDANNKINK